jgi:hypothetical protein
LDKLKKIAAYRANILVYCFLIAAFCLFLFRLPLAGQLGFEYSVFTAFFLSFLTPFYIIRHYKKENGFDKKKEFFGSLLLMALVPLLMGFINAIFIFPCSVKDGALFYLLFAFPNLAVSFSVSVFVTRVFKRFRIVITLAVLFFIALLPVIELLFYPQVYFFNPLIGFYPGTIYDEGIPIDFLLISYRLIIFVFFSAAAVYPFYSLKIKKYNKSVMLIYISLLIVSSFLFYFYSPLLGYSSDKNRVVKALGKRLETKHFSIYLPAETDSLETEIIKAEHEYYFSALSGFYNSSPDRKIASYIFRNDKEKRFLMGAGRADVAKPWIPEIYTEMASRNQTLKHEISHCFASSFNISYLKMALNINPALIEGIAVASEGTFDGIPIDFVVANARRCGYKINLSRLFNGSYSFYTNASNISYAFSGSFSKFLVEKYGIEKFKSLFGSGNYKSVYGKEYAAIENEFIDYLNNIQTEQNLHQAFYYFGGRSIFSKVCPRYVATESEKGWEYYYDKNYYLALSIFSRLEKMTSNYSSLIGIVNCQIKMNLPKEAEKLLDSRINSFNRTNYYYNLQLKLSDLAGMNDNYKKADSLLNEIKTENPNERFVGAVEFRRILMRAGRLKEYLYGSDIVKYLILKKMLTGANAGAAVPVFIDLALSLRIPQKTTQNFIEKFVLNGQNSSPGLRLSAGSILYLADYYYQNLLFDKALQLSSQNLTLVKNTNAACRLSALNDKINWVKQYCSESE